jgi:hypothetical protein
MPGYHDGQSACVLLAIQHPNDLALAASGACRELVRLQRALRVLVGGRNDQGNAAAKVVCGECMQGVAGS